MVYTKENLPTYLECVNLERKLSVLENFISKYEPLSIIETREFRADLINLLNKGE